MPAPIPATTDPLRIGRIVDRSFDDARIAAKRFALPLLVVVSVNAAGETIRQAAQEVALPWALEELALGLTVLGKLLGFLFNLVVIQFASDLWQGRPATVRRAWGRFRWRHVLRVVIMTVRFVFATFFLSLCLVIPGLVYMMNRSLALQILVIEDVTAAESLSRSRYLMTSERWYSVSGPWTRISALWVVMITLYLTSFIPLLLLTEGVGVFEAIGAGPLVRHGVVMTTSVAIQQLVTIFSTFATVGLYLDLRVRYEGADLSEAIERFEGHRRDEESGPARGGSA